MNDSQPCAVPLVELLQRIPADARYTYTEPDGLRATHFIPIGRYAHEAVALLSAKDAQIAELEREMRIMNANWQMTETKLSAAEAELARVREALSFYADPLRYQGGNQRPLPGDKFTPAGFPYRTDVTRDNGSIARAALSTDGGAQR